MEHFIDIYNKKKYGLKYCQELLNLDNIKINLKVDGKPFQVLYNKETDNIEWHGRSGNETTIGPIVDDYTRLFSKPINDAISHIESYQEIIKNYKFLTFEVIDNMLLLTAVINHNNEFINDASEIKQIANQLNTEVMPTLWEGKLSDTQKKSILSILETGSVPSKDNFINWVKDMFKTYSLFPDKLISASDEFIEGIVFFFEKDNNIIEYKLVDPTYRQLMKERDNLIKSEKDKRINYYNQVYNLMVEYLKDNACKFDNNQIISMQLNFLNMCKDKDILSHFHQLGNFLITNNSKTYYIQNDRVLSEIYELIQDSSIKNIFELFMKTFYKEKKKAFIISKEFQSIINQIIYKIQG